MCQLEVTKVHRHVGHAVVIRDRLWKGVVEATLVLIYSCGSVRFRQGELHWH